MSRLTAASLLLLLSSPYGFAAPLESELPSFQLLQTTNNVATAPQTAMSPKTGGVLTSPLPVFKLSNAVENDLADPVINEDASELSGPSVQSTNFASIVSQLAKTIGGFFKVAPGEKMPPLPVAGNNQEQFFKAAASHAASRPKFPMNNGTGPTGPLPTGARRSIRGRQGPEVQKMPGVGQKLPVVGPKLPVPVAVPELPVAVPELPVAVPSPPALPVTLPATDALPISSLSSLIGPLLDIVETLLGNIVPSLPFPPVALPDALVALSRQKSDLAALDPSVAMSIVLKLLGVATDLLPFLPVSIPAVPGQLPVAGALTGLTKRDLGLDTGVALTLAKQVLNVLLGFLNQLPLVSTATEALPLDEVLNVASALGKRDNIDPNAAVLMVKQIVDAVLGLLGTIPVVGPTVSTLPLEDTLSQAPVDTLPLSKIPLDTVTSTVPVGKILTNPLGVVPGVTPAGLSKRADLPVDVSVAAGILKTVLALVESVLATVTAAAPVPIPAVPIPATPIYTAKRDVVALPLPVDTILGLIETLLSAAKALLPVPTPDVPLPGGLGKRDAADPVATVTGLVKTVLDLITSLLSGLPLDTATGALGGLGKRAVMTQETQMLVALAEASYMELKHAMKQLKALQNAHRQRRQLGGIDIAQLTSLLTVVTDLLGTVLELTSAIPSVPAVGDVAPKLPVDPASLTGKLPVPVPKTPLRARSGTLRARQVAGLSGISNVGSAVKSAASPVAGVINTVKPDTAPLAAAADAAKPATEALKPVSDATAPVLAAIPPGAPALPIDLITDLCSLLSTLLSLDIPATPLPKRSNSSPPLKPPFAPIQHLDFSPATVRDFIRRWHTLGTRLASVDPELVDGLMAIFVDPSAAPELSDAQDLGQFPEEIRTFVVEYYAFALVLQDMGVRLQDKIDVVRALFDGGVGGEGEGEGEEEE